MGIYSTHKGITKEQAIAIIRDRISKIENMPDQRIVEILEACVQGRYYNDPNIDGGWNDEFAYNNFWSEFEKHQ